MSEPMLGMELAPVTCVGVELELSCRGGIGEGDREWVGG